MKNRQISDLLRVGSENGTTLRELVAATGLNERAVRLKIQQERKAGKLILSNNKDGYFLPESPEDVQRFVRSMSRRAAEIVETASAAERSLATLTGQKFLEGGAMTGQPGVMFYFSIRPCIRRLSASEKGQLFEAILDYAELGVEPDFDGVLGIAWDFIVPHIDKDAEAYERKVEASQYAAFVREQKKRGLTPASRDVWRSLSDIERHRMISSDERDVPETSGDIIRYPNTIAIPISNLSSELSDVAPDEPETDGKTKKTFPQESDAYKAACCLRDEIAARLPTATPPTEKQLQGWALAFDKCHRIDGHDWAEIERVLLFSQDDPFWQKNILSGEKFRKQYTALLARMGGG